MKKLYFKTINLKKWIVNFVIVFTLFIVGGASVIAGVNSVPANGGVSGVYYYGDKSSKNISLMINVYWGTEYIDQMLQIFDEYGVKTTFFVGGTWAVMNEDYLKKIDEGGHEIANHGYRHKDHDKLDMQGNIDEIKTTHNIVKNLINKDMNLFAPPSGAYNKTTLQCAKNLGYKVIMWTRDTIDWRDHDANLIYNRAVKNVSGGDLILMHPTKETAQSLPKILKTFSEKGLNATTVSKTIENIVA